MCRVQFFLPNSASISIDFCFTLFSCPSLYYQSTKKNKVTTTYSCVFDEYTTARCPNPNATHMLRVLHLQDFRLQ